MLHSHSLHIQIPLLLHASLITSTQHSSLSLSHTTPMMKMAFPLSFLISLFLLHAANAHDITQILSQYSDFSTFNSYLTLTGLATQINSRNPITVLVVDNGNLAALSTKPVDQIKNILSVHVILDYYDAAKLQTLSATSALATTLFQTTGFALGQQGFLNVTRLGTTSTIAFASAMPGSPPGSTLVKTVYSLPYNLSILQVSTAIIPQGIDGTKTSSPPSKAPSATPSATPTTTSPPPSPVISTPPPSSVITPPSTIITPPSNASSPPVAPAATPTPSAAAVPSTTPPAVPSTAPPTAAKAPIPATPSPKPSIAPIPSKAAPMASKAPVPSSAPAMAQGPAIAATPSASTASSPTANAPGAALAPGVESPTLETPGETTPAEAKPKGKSAGQTLNVGLAVVFTMVLSTLCLTSSTI